LRVVAGIGEAICRPIVIVLDNARYQRCKLVEDLAKELGVTLQFLPSYSPNLNLIEWLWKFVKKKCLYNSYYGTFEAFKAGHQRLPEPYRSRPQKRNHHPHATQFSKL
jgi:transposase